MIPKKITLEVRQEEGTWFVTSPEIPGMLLAHKELMKALAPLEVVANKLIAWNK